MCVIGLYVRHVRWVGRILATDQHSVFLETNASSLGSEERPKSGRDQVVDTGQECHLRMKSRNAWKGCVVNVNMVRVGDGVWQ